MYHTYLEIFNYYCQNKKKSMVKFWGAMWPEENKGTTKDINN